MTEKKKRMVRKFRTLFDIEQPLYECATDLEKSREMEQRYKDIVDVVARNPNAALNIAFNDPILLSPAEERLEDYAIKRIPKERCFFEGFKKKNIHRDAVYFPMGELYGGCGEFAVKRALKLGIKPSKIRPLMDVSIVRYNVSPKDVKKMSIKQRMDVVNKATRNFRTNPKFKGIKQQTVRNIRETDKLRGFSTLPKDPKYTAKLRKLRKIKRKRR